MGITRNRYLAVGLLFLAAGALVALTTAENDSGHFAQLPESPIEGGRLFMEKGCVNCHTIHGLGGTGGPDLGKVRAAWSFLDIAGVMWNHQPKMSAEFQRRKLPRPQLSSEEVFELTAFIYFLNYFGNPGDAARGELVFLRKQCVECHTVGTHGPSDGLPLDRFQAYRSPASISAALWNASPLMTVAMQEKGIARPEYEANDVADVLAFIRREATPQEQQRPAYLALGNSQEGARLFQTKGCIQCHAVQGQGGNVGPSLGSWQGEGILSQISGTIWNHGPEMWEAMRQAGVEFPEFSEDEMSSLMTYLYFASFIDPEGDPERGAALFAEKACFACHWGGEEKQAAVGLAISEMKMDTAPEIISAMWNHASEMEEAVRAADIVWPEIRPGEMGDLVAFIRAHSQNNAETSQPQPAP